MELVRATRLLSSESRERESTPRPRFKKRTWGTPRWFDLWEGENLLG